MTRGDMGSEQRGIRVLELFSGIGGMRCGLSDAFRSSGLKEPVFTSVDLNEFCNGVYADSYGESPIAADISSLSVEWFDNLHAHVWTMSPPCQPYSRQGKMKDSADERAQPLTHLLNVLSRMQNLPKFVLLENVKNFEVSESFRELQQILHTRGYDMQQYLLNPLFMGFPNSRLRFFLVAHLRQDLTLHAPTATILCNDPSLTEYEFMDPSVYSTGDEPKGSISDFLCPSHTEEVDSQLTVPLALLETKKAFCFDIVAPSSKQCLCFTKSYTKYVNGTGSVLFQGSPGLVRGWDDMERPKFQVDSMTELDRSLRYFCPLEAARLNGFDTATLKLCGGCQGSIHCYRAVGNSLNPHVVAFLVQRHLIDSGLASRLAQ